MEKSNVWKALLTNLSENRNALFRLWIIIASIHIVSLLLGIGVWLITTGIYIMLRRIFIYWPPAREWLSRAIGLKLREQSRSEDLYRYWWAVILIRVASTLVIVVMGIYCIRVGIGILVRDGFLSQNLIYMIIHPRP